MERYCSSERPRETTRETEMRRTLAAFLPLRFKRLQSLDSGLRCHWALYDDNHEPLPPHGGARGLYSACTGVSRKKMLSREGVGASGT
jgi:hypothetical protein